MQYIVGFIKPTDGEPHVYFLGPEFHGGVLTCRFLINRLQKPTRAKTWRVVLIDEAGKQTTIKLTAQRLPYHPKTSVHMHKTHYRFEEHHGKK